MSGARSGPPLLSRPCRAPGEDARGRGHGGQEVAGSEERRQPDDEPGTGVLTSSSEGQADGERVPKRDDHSARAEVRPVEVPLHLDEAEPAKRGGIAARRSPAPGSRRPPAPSTSTYIQPPGRKSGTAAASSASAGLRSTTTSCGAGSHGRPASSTVASLPKSRSDSTRLGSSTPTQATRPSSGSGRRKRQSRRREAWSSASLSRSNSCFSLSNGGSSP